MAAGMRVERYSKNQPSDRDCVISTLSFKHCSYPFSKQLQIVQLQFAWRRLCEGDNRFSKKARIHGKYAKPSKSKRFCREVGMKEMHRWVRYFGLFIKRTYALSGALEVFSVIISVIHFIRRSLYSAGIMASLTFTLTPKRMNQLQTKTTRAIKSAMHMVERFGQCPRCHIKIKCVMVHNKIKE